MTVCDGPSNETAIEWGSPSFFHPSRHEATGEEPPQWKQNVHKRHRSCLLVIGRLITNKKNRLRGLTEHRLPRTNKAVLADCHVPTFLCCCYASLSELYVLPTFLYCVTLPRGATAVPLAHFVSSVVASIKLAPCRVLFWTVLACLVVRWICYMWQKMALETTICCFGTLQIISGK